MREINFIVVHCSDSDYDHHDDISVIRDWHVNENGWSDVGYHFFIKNNGEIQRGRDIDIPGAHVRGFNDDSIGICLHGKEIFTKEQRTALIKLLRDLINEYNLDSSNIYGHYELDNTKTCPNFPMDYYRNKLINNTF